jgi:anti-anti-sigma regulatory factor
MQQSSDAPNANSRDGFASVETRSVPGGGVIVALVGDHDLSAKTQLLESLAGVGRHARLIIDLSRCTFVDSTIIAVVLAASHSTAPCEQRVSLVLPNDTSYVYRALSVIGMRDLVSVHRSIEAALDG